MQIVREEEEKEEEALKLGGVVIHLRGRRTRSSVPLPPVHMEVSCESMAWTEVISHCPMTMTRDVPAASGHFETRILPLARSLCPSPPAPSIDFSRMRELRFE